MHDLLLFVLKTKTQKYSLGKVISMEINTGRSVRYRQPVCLLNRHIQIFII